MTEWAEGVSDAHKRRVLLERLERDETKLAEATTAYEKASEKARPYVTMQAQARGAEWRAKERLEETRRELAALLTTPPPVSHAPEAGQQ